MLSNLLSKKKFNLSYLDNFLSNSDNEFGLKPINNKPKPYEYGILEFENKFITHDDRKKITNSIADFLYDEFKQSLIYKNTDIKNRTGEVITKKGKKINEINIFYPLVNSDQTIDVIVSEINQKGCDERIKTMENSKNYTTNSQKMTDNSNDYKYGVLNGSIIDRCGRYCDVVE